MVWWRQAHVVTDICCGIAVFAFALWAARQGAAQSTNGSFGTNS
jgi:hypothetical protein